MKRLAPLLILLLAARADAAPYTSGGPFSTQGTGIQSGSGITLGTSTSATNPARVGDATTGLYSSGAGAIDFSSAGTAIGQFDANGLSLTTPFFGVVNASSCGNTFKPTWCSGSDIGAWVNAAVAAASGTYLKITVDPTQSPYTQSTAMVFGSNTILDLQGSTLNWNSSSGDAVQINEASTSPWFPGTLENGKITYVAGYTGGNTNECLYLGGDPTGAKNSAARYAGWVKIKNIECRGFNNDFAYGNNTWATSLENVAFHDSNNGIYSAARMSGAITSFSITSNVATVTFSGGTSPAGGFSNGNAIQISGLATGTYLNGQILTVASATGTSFTAPFTHADVGLTSDTGTAAFGCTNCGEEMMVKNSAIYNNATYGFNVNTYLDDWSFTGGSFDFNGNAIGGTSGLISATNVHFEQGSGAFVSHTTTTAGYVMKFHARGGVMWMDTASGTDNGYILAENSGDNISLQDVDLFSNHTVNDQVFTNALSTATICTRDLTGAGSNTTLTDATTPNCNQSQATVSGNLTATTAQVGVNGISSNTTNLKLTVNSASTTVPGSSLAPNAIFAGASAAANTIEFGAAAGSNTLLAYRQNTSWASGSALASGDAIFNINGRGWDTAESGTRVQMIFAADGTWSAGSDATRIVFLTTPSGSTTLTEAMRITSAQRVGIGLTPNSILDVGNSSGSAFRVAPTASEVDYVQATGGVTGNPGLATLSAQGSDSNVSLALTPKGTGQVISNGPIQQIYDQGVGSGFLSQFALERAASTAGVEGGYHAQGSFADAGWLGGGPASTSALYLTSRGSAGALITDLYLGNTGTTTPRVGVGKASAAFTLDVGGTLSLDTFGGATATTVCQNAGQLSTCSSSRRYKENETPATFGLADVLKMQPVEFDWKARKLDDPTRHDIGMIAEDMEKINPLFVFYKDGKIEGIKYTPFDAVLVAAVKDQQKEIEALKGNSAINACAEFGAFGRWIMGCH